MFQGIATGMVSRTTKDFKLHLHHPDHHPSHPSSSVSLLLSSPFSFKPPFTTQPTFNNRGPWAPLQTTTTLTSRRNLATHGTRAEPVFEAPHAIFNTSATDVDRGNMEEQTVRISSRHNRILTTPPPVSGPGSNSLPLNIVHKFVNLSRFEELLRGYPNPDLVHFVLNGFKHGFNLGFRGTINEEPLRNNKTARDNPSLVSAAIAKELERGHTAGPFVSPPFEHCHVFPPWCCT